MTMFDNEVSAETTATETPADDFDLFGDGDTDTETDLFDTSDDNDDNEQSENSEESENGATEETEKPVTYKLKHLSEEKEVTLEEMQALAQKGMDYDYIRKGFDEYKQMFNELAQDADLTPEQFITEYRKEMQEMKIQQRTAEIMEEELVAEQVAERLARAEVENETIKKGRERKEKELAQKEQAEKQTQDAILQDVKYLQKIRPEVGEPDFKVPEEVMKRIQEDGLPLSTAYLGWIAEQTETKLKKVEQAEKNRQKNVGSMKSAGASKQDDFVKALFSD